MKRPTVLSIVHRLRIIKSKKKKGCPLKLSERRMRVLKKYAREKCSYRALCIAAYLENEEVKRMQWPAQSPDLIPIENIWSLMKGRLRKRHVYTSSPMQLFSILNEIWNSLPTDYSDNQTESMPKRVKMVRTVRGE